MTLRLTAPVLAGSSALMAVLITAEPHTAEACGGCFSPPETVTSVDSHRMVVSLSPERSILWDQIRYTGDPEDFVWVLPVPSGEAMVAVADDLFFAELENQSAPLLNPPALPPLDCPPPPDDDCGFGGCGSASGNSDGGAVSLDAGVDVYREEVVGPYETVVVGSEDPAALVNWLNDHGYQVPEETLPVIDHYTQNDMVFVVLRLAPDQGVSAMQPIRVEYPGYMATFPLKMVTVGAYGSLQMTLWVMAEQRYKPTNFAEDVIEGSDLVWDFFAGSSDYQEVFRDRINQLGGRAWITQMAQPLSYLYFESEEIALVHEDIRYPFVTRLQTDMLVDHLSTDLELGPSDEGYVDRWLQVENYVNDPRSCPDYDGNGQPDTWEEYRRTQRGWVGCVGCAGAGGAGGGIALALVGLLLVWRRRRKG